MPQFVEQSKRTLTRRVGPLPVWGYGAVAIGGVGAWWMFSRGKRGSGSAQLVEAAPSNVSFPGVSGGPGAGGISASPFDFLPFAGGNDSSPSEPLAIPDTFFDRLNAQLGDFLNNIRETVPNVVKPKPSANLTFAPGVKADDPELLPFGQFESAGITERKAILPALQKLPVGSSIYDPNTGKTFTQHGTQAGALSALSPEQFALVPDFVKRAVTVGSNLTPPTLTQLHRQTLPEFSRN